MEQPLIPEHPGYSPMLKSLRDLSIRFEGMVTEEVVDDASLRVDGGMHIPIPPPCARSIRSPPPVVDFPEISSQNSNNGIEESGKVNVHPPFLE
jgi:hypothetical protein